MQVSDIRQQLLQRRREILEQRETKSDSWQKLQEPEVEFEEEAAKEKMARALEQLDDQQKIEIEQIDAALGKLGTTGYGICESCGEKISESRLEAIPWTPFCIDCAEKEQGGPVQAPPGYEKIEGAATIREQKSYTDDELLEMLGDQLVRDGRVETSELEITIDDGWIYLEGLLPGKTKHEILISIIQDVLGFKDFVDRIQIDRQLWEQQRRARGLTREPMTDEEKRMESEGGETDVWSSQEFGTPLEPPDRLDPEKKTE